MAGHITARDPELTDHFWVNPYGQHFGQVRVSDLVIPGRKIDVPLELITTKKCSCHEDKVLHEELASS